MGLRARTASILVSRPRGEHPASQATVSRLSKQLHAIVAKSVVG